MKTICLKMILQITTIFLSAVFSLTDSNPIQDGACVLPDITEIDYNMLPGTWYQVLNTDDPYDKRVKCFTSRNFRSSTDGGYAEEVTFQVNANKTISHTVIPIHWFKEGESIINLDQRFKFLWIDEAVADGAKPRALEEVDGFFDIRVTTMTDYENYFIYLQCGKYGTKYVWVFMRNNRPSTEDILRIHNKLIELEGGWSNVKLYLSGCTQLDMPIPI